MEQLFNMWPAAQNQGWHKTPSNMGMESSVKKVISCRESDWHTCENKGPASWEGQKKEKQEPETSAAADQLLVCCLLLYPEQCVID